MESSATAMDAAELFTEPIPERFSNANRLWQGIPSIEVVRGGALYATWFSGATTEEGGNYVIVARSDDGGSSWRDVLVVSHVNDEVRCFDPCIWVDPNGRLMVTWNQSNGFFDGRVGVWTTVSDSPEDHQPAWSPPRRLANGIMLNKPTVTSAGEWLFPCAIWAYQEPTEHHPELAGERRSNVYVSTDQGATFTLRGGADVPNRQGDEHMVVERRDGSLWMLVRCYDGIGEAFSRDGGRTWYGERRSHIDSPTSRFHIRRLRSGRLLLINHVDFGERLTREEIESQGNVKSWIGRKNLMALLSEDDGLTWPYKLMVDARDDSAYPDACEGDDGQLYVVYDWHRMDEQQVFMARFFEEEIIEGRLSHKDSALRMTVVSAPGAAD